MLGESIRLDLQFVGGFALGREKAKEKEKNRPTHFFSLHKYNAHAQDPNTLHILTTRIKIKSPFDSIFKFGFSKQFTENLFG